MIEKEKQLFFPSEIFIYLGYFGYIRIFLSITFETVKRKESGTKKHDFRTNFPLSNFQSLWKFKNRFYYQSKQMFLNSRQFFRKCASFFVKVLTQNQVWSMPLHQPYCLTLIYSCIKSDRPKVMESWLIWAVKSSKNLANVIKT